MLSAKNNLVPFGAILLALGLFMFTGCAKDELVEPGKVPTMTTKAEGQDVSGPGTVVTGGESVPISDDGDDLGDRERSNKHNPN